MSVTKNGNKRDKGNGGFEQHYTIGDIEDRNRFVEQHLPLVSSIASKYMNRGVDFEDLVQEGILGLMTAAERFDPQKGFRFSTYACWWIRQAIDSCVSSQSDVVNKPSGYNSYLKRILKASDALEIKLGRKPDMDEIAGESEMSKEMVQHLLALIPGTLSLNMPVKQDDELRAPEFLDKLQDTGAASPTDLIIKSHLRKDIDEAMDSLSDVERRVIDMRFGLSRGETMSLRTIAKQFGLTAERIRQIEAKALIDLKEKGTEKKLQDYLN